MPNFDSGTSVKLNKSKSATFRISLNFNPKMWGHQHNRKTDLNQVRREMWQGNSDSEFKTTGKGIGQLFLRFRATQMCRLSFSIPKEGKKERKKLWIGVNKYHVPYPLNHMDYSLLLIKQKSCNFISYPLLPLLVK